MNAQAVGKPGVFVAPAKRDLQTLAGQLSDWLGRRMPAARDIRVENLDYPRGAGQSHETILFDAAWEEGGEARQRGMVVRIKPTSFTVFLDDMFVEQYRLMRVMHESGRVKVAEVLWYEEDPSILGAPFFVMEKLDGRVAVSIPSYMEEGWVFEATPEERARLWRNGVHQLTAIQSVPLESVGFLARPAAGDGFAQELDRWRRFLDFIRARRPLPFHEAAFRQIEATAPANRPPGLVWGDARIGNMMAGDDFEILAVMDWEQPSLGGALHDLGWWLFNDRMKVIARGGEPLAGIGGREETIALWRELTGISTDGIDWYEGFAGFKMSCLSVNMMDMRGEALPQDFAQTPMGEQVSKLLQLQFPAA
jgi:aminoglycoside phosphotransferase (APT) family kinase protein